MRDVMQLAGRYLAWIVLIAGVAISVLFVVLMFLGPIEPFVHQPIRPWPVVEAPEHGVLEVGVHYHVIAGCGRQFKAGDYLWAFNNTENVDLGTRPPGGEIFTPDPAPGVLTLTSQSAGIVVGDWNGAEYQVTRVGRTGDWLCGGI